jgi:predicted enzyme related to lactoylglutathione lyase
MPGKLDARLLGIELYFDDLVRARQFYSETLGLDLASEEIGHQAQFHAGEAFVCLERKGAESYPSRDKAVLFLEVPDLDAALDAVGREKVVQIGSIAGGSQPAWAVLHDPEGHNILLLEAQGNG